jgi:hypothetical protein
MELYINGKCCYKTSYIEAVNFVARDEPLG